MYKLLLFLFLGGYAFYKVINFIFRMLNAGGQIFEQAQKFYQPSSKDGKVQIQNISEEEKKRRRQSQKFKGGEYVDYEESN